MTSDIGIHWWPLVTQSVLIAPLIVLPVVLAIHATVVSLRAFHGIEALIWFSLCWLLPIIGPIAALLAARKAQDSTASHVA